MKVEEAVNRFALANGIVDESTIADIVLASLGSIGRISAATAGLAASRFERAKAKVIRAIGQGRRKV